VKLRVHVQTPQERSRGDRLAHLVDEALAHDGRALPTESRSELEGRFGHDLSAIRVHTGPPVDALLGEIGAQAASVGDDLLFGAGRYRPDVVEGRRLLAHEVAHALQARRGAAPAPDDAVAWRVGDDVGREADARRAAGLATSGRAVGPLSAGDGRPTIDRFVWATPLREAAAALADPFVEMLALDLVRALEADPADAEGRAGRRIGRLAEDTRAAVVARVSEMLTPAQREAASPALTGAIAPGREVGVQAVDLPREGQVADEARGPAAEESLEESTQESADPEGQAPLGHVSGAAEPDVGEPEGDTDRAEGVEGVDGMPAAAWIPPTSSAPPAAEGADSVAGTAAPNGAGAIAEPEADLGPLDLLVDEGPSADAADAPTPAEPAPGPTEEPAASVADVAPSEAADAPATEEPVAGAPVTPEMAPPPAIQDIEPATTPETPAPEPAEAGSPAEPAPTPEETALAAAPEPGPDPVEPAMSAVTAGQASDHNPSEPADAGPVVTETPTKTAGATDAAAATTPALAEPLASPEGTASTPTAEGGGDCGPEVAPGGVPSSAPVADAPVAEAPVADPADPAGAMAGIAGLAPAEAGVALSGVAGAATAATAAERERLAAEPPSMERPSGSPETRPVTASPTGTPGPPSSPSDQPALVPAPTPAPVTAPAALPPPPEAAVASVPSAPIAGGAQGTVSASDAEALRSSLDDLPMTDPGLALDAGPVPTVSLDGDADPQRVQAQRHDVDARASETREAGRAELAQAVGEADIYPDVPAETLVAEVPPGDAVAAPQAVEPVDPVAAAIARRQDGGAVRAAVIDARAQMAEGRLSHERDVAEGREASRREVDDLVRANAAQQAEERSAARAQVADERRKWSEEQERAVADSRDAADAQSRRAGAEVTAERDSANRQAAEHIATGNEKAQAARIGAERDARAKRDQARSESKGVLGWLADTARGFFETLKRGLGAIFEAARRVVREAVRTAQNLASAVIDAARRRITALVLEIAGRLVAIAGVLLASFPALRDRFRAAMVTVVRAAIAAVNRLASLLKEGVRLALGALAAVIQGYLGLLEKVYVGAVDLVAGAVQSVIRSAQAVAKGLGEFAGLVVDIAQDPVRWITNLGAAVLDGLRNHVWRVIKCQVKAWFRAKVEEVVGLGRAIIDLLRRGGISLATIARTVWEALKAALPGIAIQLAIEKLISLLVPAASALMLIIDGLRAAWGAMGRIITAFQKFFVFLKAVKTGNAGRQFAEALAAGAIALIDFLSNFLVVRLRKAAGGAAGKLSALARKIGGGVTKAAGSVVRGARKVGGAVIGAGRRGLAAMRRVGDTLVAAVAKLPAVGRRLRGLRARWRLATAKYRCWRERRRKKGAATAQQRLDRAVTAIRPPLERLVRRGVGGTRMAARLAWWMVRWRLSSLRFVGNEVVAQVNPKKTVASARLLRDAEIGRALEPLLRRAEAAFLSRVARTSVDDLDAARRGLERGDSSAFRRLSSTQQLIVLRSIRAGQIPLGKRYLTLQQNPGGGGVGVSVRDRRNLGTLFVRIPARRRGRGLLPAGGTYDALTRSVRAFSLKLRVSQRLIMFIAMARNEEQLLARFRGLTGRWSLRKQRVGEQDLLPTLRGLRFLTQSLEPARATGMLPVAMVSAELGGTGRTLLDPVHGGGPMMTEGSSSAAHARWSQGADTALAQEDQPLTSRQRRAENIRRARIARVFKNLRHAATRGTIRAPSQQAAEALSALAEGFDAWLRQHVSAKDEDALSVSANAVVSALIAYMEAFEGR
jgi:hypothetical protein